MENIGTELHTVAETDEWILQAQCMLPGKFVIHATVYEWSKESYKRMLEAWPIIVNEFHKNGVEYLYTLVPEGADKSERFSIAFGFKPVEIYKGYLANGKETTFTGYVMKTDPEEYL